MWLYWSAECRACVNISTSLLSDAFFTAVFSQRFVVFKACSTYLHHLNAALSSSGIFVNSKLLLAYITFLLTPNWRTKTNFVYFYQHPGLERKSVCLREDSCSTAWGSVSPPVNPAASAYPIIPLWTPVSVQPSVYRSYAVQRLTDPCYFSNLRQKTNNLRDNNFVCFAPGFEVKFLKNVRIYTSTYIYASPKHAHTYDSVQFPAETNTCASKTSVIKLLFIFMQMIIFCYYYFLL